MIPRYTRPEMARIWSDENRFRKWLDIEVAACEAQAQLGVIPKDAVEVIKEKANFDAARVHEIEKEVKHDVIAFLTSVSEYVGPEARFIHQGMTSSDVLDTAFALQLREAADLLLQGLDGLMQVLKKRALEHRDTIMIGRSHGIHAEPVTFGLKLAVWFDEMKRNRVRLMRARETISVGMLSGAVGTFANISPKVEEFVCEKLGLRPSKASTQVIQRDRHAEYFSTLAIVAASIEKIAVEIRHLQRTEVYEAEEYFSAGQKGSSAMPHKRNPVLSENLTGLARLMRGYAASALENVALWHERDISHSSVERIIGPDATVTLDFMLHRAINVIDNLLVYPERMKKNLEMTGGLPFSQYVLLLLTQKGISREAAYRIVQRNAMKVWEEGGQFKDRLLDDPEVTKAVSVDEIDKAFDMGYHTKHIDTIFERVFG
ncbi:MAG: adenylosuccinate lyase [Alphaproteobacteria bacterium CG_4_10_14_0_2_um_filter_63_37]|nr:MAG: adenylosuccinate lyase [Proteobacteria bacterium CG1_02_64_396]PJA25464.1 MAG: adenylosuccinate lyase [Alphaproteobacteria bacterium CG_4_10_14_0_2_um_filter_63_37]